MRIFQLKTSPLRGSNSMYNAMKHSLTSINVVDSPVVKRYVPSMMDMSLEDLGRLINKKGK